MGPAWHLPLSDVTCSHKRVSDDIELESCRRPRSRCGVRAGLRALTTSKVESHIPCLTSSSVLTAPLQG